MGPSRQRRDHRGDGSSHRPGERSACDSLGYQVNRYKMLAFVLSAAISGLAGSTKALVFQVAILGDIHWHVSGEAILMTLPGGVGTLLGPVVGAIFLWRRGRCIGVEPFCRPWRQRQWLGSPPVHCFAGLLQTYCHGRLPENLMTNLTSGSIDGGVGSLGNPFAAAIGRVIEGDLPSLRDELMRIGLDREEIRTLCQTIDLEKMSKEIAAVNFSAWLSRMKVMCAHGLCEISSHVIASYVTPLVRRYLGVSKSDRSFSGS